MRIEKYGVVLTRLTHNKIEMVRNWRNDPKISQFMEYQEYITPEMQEKWFQKIDNKHNFYFVASFAEEEIGLINIKDIDYEKKTGEGGMFIYDERYWNSDVSFRLSLCCGDFEFEELGIQRHLLHIRKSNKRAIDYNKAFGAVLQPDQEDVDNQLYIIEPETYFRKRERLRQLLL